MCCCFCWRNTDVVCATSPPGRDQLVFTFHIVLIYKQEFVVLINRCSCRCNVSIRYLIVEHIPLAHPKQWTLKGALRFMKCHVNIFGDIVCNNNYSHSHSFSNLLVHTHLANTSARAVTTVATCLVQTELQNNFDSDSWTLIISSHESGNLTA